MYGTTTHRRFIVPPSLASWNVAFEDYLPVEYTNSLYCCTKRAPYADIEDCKQITFNNWDAEKSIDRRSYSGSEQTFYQIENGAPLCPLGRTGVVGRGDLHLWGPTHAVDPIIVRWKSKEQKQMEFLAIKREDGR